MNWAASGRFPCPATPPCVRAAAPRDDKRLHDALAHAADGKRCFVTLARQQEAGLTIAVIPLRARGALHRRARRWCLRVRPCASR